MRAPGEAPQGANERASRDLRDNRVVRAASRATPQAEHENPVVLRLFRLCPRHTVESPNRTPGDTEMAALLPASASDPAIPHDPAAERLGHALIDDVVAGDFDALEELLAPDVRFRALTPRTNPQESTAAATRAVIEGWFEGTRDRELLASSVDSVVDRLLVGFRIRLWEEGSRRVVEQRVVARVADGHLTDVALVCSGFAVVEEAGPVATAPSAGDRADRRLDGLGLSCATLTPTIASGGPRPRAGSDARGPDRRSLGGGRPPFVGAHDRPPGGRPRAGRRGRGPLLHPARCCAGKRLDLRGHELMATLIVNATARTG